MGLIHKRLSILPLTDILIQRRVVHNCLLLKILHELSFALQQYLKFCRAHFDALIENTAPYYLDFQNEMEIYFNHLGTTG